MEVTLEPTTQRSLELDQLSDDHSTSDNEIFTIFQSDCKNPDSDLTALESRKIPQLTDMSALYKAMVEKRSKDVVESLQLSLSNTLKQCFDGVTPNERLLQEQLDKQRQNFEQQINNLRNENRQLKGELAQREKNEHTFKTVDVQEYKAKLKAASTELMKKQAKITELNDQYVKMMTEVKKKQWCATCLMPFGTYYCSSQCQQNTS